MRGQRMRCPNTVCREVFEVREDEPAPAAGPQRVVREDPPPPRPDQAIEPPAGAYVVGRVGDDIPLVPIEEETPAPPEEEASEVIPLLPAEIAQETSRRPAREVRSWDEPPPVRRPGAA